MVQVPKDSEAVPQVMAFIHSHLSKLRFALRRDVVDHRDILLLSFFNRGECHFLMNVYLDDCHSAVKFMLDQVIDIPNLLYMGRDFNVRDAEWDPSVSSHPAVGQALMDLADSLGLVRSLPALPVPTHYSDTDGHANSVIDLIFLDMSRAQISYRIKPDLRLSSDHVLLLVDLSISPENIYMHRKALKHDSEEENTFLLATNMGLHALNFSGLDSIVSPDLLAQAISEVFSRAWKANARNITVTNQSKEWWNDKCKWALKLYRHTRAKENWHAFRSSTKHAKQSFFDNRIVEIASTNKCP